jgi:hypothetical protein
MIADELHYPYDKILIREFFIAKLIMIIKKESQNVNETKLMNDTCNEFKNLF